MRQEVAVESNFFFICGLPRSRLAWTANYLTYGNTFCLHDGLKYCSSGVGELDGVMPALPYRGNSDAANVLSQDKLKAVYPDAKWVLIERPYSEVEDSVKALGEDPAGLHLIQAKMEEMRGKFNPLVVKFDELDSRITEIAAYVNPTWNCFQLRHEMLVGLNVQADYNKAKAEIAEMPSLVHLVEPVILSQTCLDYMELIRQAFDNNAAYKWYEDLVHSALMWDHFVDGDGIHPDLVDRVMTALLTEWPVNMFWQKYADYLVPTMVGAISAWRDSYNIGASKDLAYEVYAAVPAAVCFVLGGTQRVNKFVPQIREYVRVLRLQDDARDGGKL